MNGITLNGKHSFSDFDLIIKSRSINMPSINIIQETIPFTNESYDFSNIYGQQTYSERLLEYKFDLIGKTKIDMNIKKIKILKWLVQNEKTKLYDDAITGFYFLAKCEDVDFKEESTYGEITIKFTAYPFKIRDVYEGNIPWDNFNFELDYLQKTIFIVTGSRSISIYNDSSTKITPVVVASENIEIIKNDTSYKFIKGSTKDYRFELDIGDNRMILKGYGSIEFKFRKEML